MQTPRKPVSLHGPRGSWPKEEPLGPNSTGLQEAIQEFELRWKTYHATKIQAGRAVLFEATLF